MWGVPLPLYTVRAIAGKLLELRPRPDPTQTPSYPDLLPASQTWKPGTISFFYQNSSCISVRTAN